MSPAPGHGSRRGAVRFGAWLATVGVVVGAATATGPAPGAARGAGAEGRPGAVFAGKLAASGRGESRFERVAADPLGGRSRRSRGRVVLEPPDRVRVEFHGSGEQIVVRSGAGEWLQPRLRQMIVLGPAQAAAAARWWRVLTGSPVAGMDVEPAGPRRHRVLVAGSDTAWVTTDRGGLPVTLEISEAGGPTRYRFLGWSFSRARGESAFVLRAPEGFEVIRLARP